MNRRMLVTQAVAATLATIALATSSAAATLQDSGAKPDVQIQAGKIVTVKQGVGIRPDMQDQVVQLTDRISVADLDLTTASGEAELENRIRDTANSVCDQLMGVGPASPAMVQFSDRNNCVHDATQGAMIQARQMIQLAQQAKRRG